MGRKPPKKQKKDPNMYEGVAAVPAYLMHSYLYYVQDQTIESDRWYDNLCKHVLKNYDKITHPHKHFITKEDLEAGTGFGLDWNEIPQRVIQAAHFLFKERTGSTEALGCRYLGFSTVKDIKEKANGKDKAQSGSKAKKDKKTKKQKNKKDRSTGHSKSKRGNGPKKSKGFGL